MGANLIERIRQCTFAVDVISRAAINMFPEIQAARQELSEKEKRSAYSTKYSQAVSHPSTNMARCCLTAVIRRELVLSTWYGRRRQTSTDFALTLKNIFRKLAGCFPEGKIPLWEKTYWGKSSGKPPTIKANRYMIESPKQFILYLLRQYIY